MPEEDEDEDEEQQRKKRNIKERNGIQTPVSQVSGREKQRRHEETEPGSRATSAQSQPAGKKNSHTGGQREDCLRQQTSAYTLLLQFIVTTTKQTGSAGAIYIYQQRGYCVYIHTPKK